jgi:outer membrane receptor for ferrienterochelin and colicins
MSTLDTPYRARLLVCLILYTSSVWAQEPATSELGGPSLADLSKVIVESANGASRFLRNASDAATSMTVVTAEEIQKHGYRTLADVLRNVRGLYVINDRNYSYVSMRGLSKPGDYNARILFLIDGHRVNDNIFDGAYVGSGFPIDIDLIARINIIRGPDSSVYGTGAFVGVIDVITKRGRDIDDVELTAEAGSQNSRKGRVSYGSRFENGLETLFSGSFLHNQGNDRLFFPAFDSPATNNGIAENADGAQAYSIFADVIYRDLNIHALHSSITKHIPTASFGTVFNDSRTRTTDSRSYVDFQYNHTFGSWEMLGRAAVDWYDYHGTYVFDYAGSGSPPYTENYDAASGTWLDFHWDASRVFFQRHDVTLGTELRQDIRQNQVNYDVEPYQSYLDDHRSAGVRALYFQDEYSPGRNLAFVVGLRSDWHTKFKNSLSPRAGLRFSPKPNTNVRATYSRAFRAPNSFETFYAGNNSNLVNLLLKPERIRSWEVNVEHHFRENYYVSGSGFLNRIDDLIEQKPDPFTGDPIYENSDPVRTKGLALELGAKWPGGADGSISYSLQDTRNVGTGDVLPNSPKHLAKVNFSVPLGREQFFASVDAQYVSMRKTVAQTELGGFFVMNVTFLARKIGNKVDLSGSVYNVFDRQYADSGGLEHVQTSIPQSGRTLRIKLEYRPGGSK